MAQGLVSSSVQRMGQPTEAIKLPAPETKQYHAHPESSTTVSAVALKVNTTKVLLSLDQIL